MSAGCKQEHGKKSEMCFGMAVLSRSTSFLHETGEAPARFQFQEFVLPQLRCSRSFSRIAVQGRTTRQNKAMRRTRNIHSKALPSEVIFYSIQFYIVRYWGRFPGSPKLYVRGT